MFILYNKMLTRILSRPIQVKTITLLTVRQRPLPTPRQTIPTGK